MEEDKKSQRPRIQRPQTTPAIADPLEFKGNRSTPNARLVCNVIDKSECEIWLDKHYHIRYQHGDENGKRIGIEPAIVESVVKKSIKYLLAFSSMVKTFKFINYVGQNEPLVSVVLKEESHGSTLNVVIQVHFLEINKYEVTVKTAMCVEDFRIESGQFAIVLDETGAVLKKWVNGNMQLICEI